ncbi:MAG TPA: hypothetical protein VGM69_08435 [Chloroflexota bacterium]|jgi:hypothetical protein
MIPAARLPGYRVLERATHVAPLGLRFWDAVAGAAVGDGLEVVARSLEDPTRRVEAEANRSGVYVFHRLPGLRVAEAGTGDAAFWASPPATRRFVVEVADRAGRFVPLCFEAEAPTRGLFSLACLPLDSPPASPPAGRPLGVRLYSSAERPVPPGLAALRAELWDPLAERPAAWAVLETRVEGLPVARGLADERGRLVVIVPYPEPLSTGLGSPPGPDGLHSPPASRRLTEQSWPVTLRARYAARPGASGVPDLCDLLAQPPAPLWADTARTEQLVEARLLFGQELVLRTRDTAGGGPLSALWITPAGSPP